MDSVKVGMVVKEILSNTPELTEIVGEKINPLIAPVDSYPFVVYRRSGTVPEDTKDRLIVSTESTVEILAVSDQYTQAVEIASIIGDAMRGKKGQIAGMKVRNIIYESDDEDYFEDAFVEKVTFKIQIQ